MKMPKTWQLRTKLQGWKCLAFTRFLVEGTDESDQQS